jgi:hypothetical protein
MKPRFTAGIAGVFIALAASLGLFSCTSHIGYGVINWSVPEHALSAGDIVPVFIKSNISKVYVVGAGKSRIELPLWQLTLYKSKAKAKKAAAANAEFRHSYATVKIDGLPVRSDPENTARQVYRLKLGQKIKIVTKGEGVPVLVGNSPLPGEWYSIMTDDGTVGWCFSYNLTVWDEEESPNGPVQAVAAGPDETLENLLARAWYPDSYRAMIESNRIDLTKIDPAWGFFPGNDSLVARIEGESGVVTFPYTSIEKTPDGLYEFKGSSLRVQVRRRDAILVTYSDAAGMPQAQYFSAIGTDPASLIAAENERRSAALGDIRDAGPNFTSGNYGVLRFLADGKFLWSGYQLLSPTAIPQNAGSVGSVSLECFLDGPLASEYDGVLSFRFESALSRVSFLYDLTPKGLKLEFVAESNVKDSVVQTRNLNPIVVFFTPGQGGQ